MSSPHDMVEIFYQQDQEKLSLAAVLLYFQLAVTNAKNPCRLAVATNTRPTLR